MSVELVAERFIGPDGPGQVVAYTGTAGTIANALPPSATFVWVFVTTIAHVKVAKGSPTATTADIPLPASYPVKIPLPGNDGTYKVSAIQSASGGNLHVCPVAY